VTESQGRRRPDGTAPWDLQPGDYCLRGGVVWVNLPNGNGPARLGGWEHTEHDDGTITVSPSIAADAIGGFEGWHGYLEGGAWRTA
jgi:hypothetical protein